MTSDPKHSTDTASVFTRFNTSLKRLGHEMFVERRSIALRAGAANALAILLGVLMGDPVFGVMGYFGTFIIQYGEGRAYKYRFKLQLAALASVSFCVLVGYWASTQTFMGWLVLIAVSFTSVLTVQVVNIGPPGAFYMMLATGVGLLLEDRGSDLLTLFSAIAMGAILSLLLTAIDTLANPHKPEIKAVDKVIRLVDRYENLENNAANQQETIALQAAITKALVEAWSTLIEAGLVQKFDLPESSAQAIRVPTDKRAAPVLQKGASLLGRKKQADTSLLATTRDQETKKSVSVRVEGQQADTSPQPENGEQQTDTNHRKKTPKLPRDFEQELQDAHYRFISREAFLSAHDYALKKSPGFGFGSPQQIYNRVPIKAGEFSGKILGKPTFVSAMEDSLRWPSEALLIAGRSMIGAAIAGLLCIQFGSGRVDWAMAFAVMLLNMGGSRKERYWQTLGRAGIAALGILGAMLLVKLPFTPLIFAVEIFIFRYIFVSLSKRYYNFSTIFMAVLAIVSIGISVEGFHLETINQMAAERAVDSIFSLIGVFFAITFTFRMSDELFIRGYNFRTVQAISHVIDDVVLERVDSTYAMTNRRRLYLALLASEAVSIRACQDDPENAGPYRPVTQELQRLGYQVVGACLHPVMIADPVPFKHAGKQVTIMLSQPFNQPKQPGELIELIQAAQTSLKTGR